MEKLNVAIEKNGISSLVGNIRSGMFQYNEDYLNAEDARAISLSLPLQKESFSEEKTKNYFDGLLPEGFTRQAVAGALRVDETDYLSILKGLGNECLGAVRIYPDGEEDVPMNYEKLRREQILELAAEGAAKSADLVTKAHLSLTGASGKAGLYYDAGQDTWYLPKGCAPSTHIVKQSHVRLENIVSNEQLCMTTAGKLGLTVPHSFIVGQEDKREDAVLFATQRFDREIPKDGKMIDGLTVPGRLHQEDMAQAMSIPAFQKYDTEGGDYCQRMFRLLMEHSADPIADRIKLWDKLIFDYLVGNTDNHIKNISLLYDRELRVLRLAPIYDVISTVVYPSSTRNMGIAIGGRISIDQINGSVFLEETEKSGLGRKFADGRFEDICSRFENALSEAARELCDMGFISAKKMADQILRLGGYGIC